MARKWSNAYLNPRPAPSTNPHMRARARRDSIRFTNALSDYTDPDCSDYSTVCGGARTNGLWASFGESDPDYSDYDIRMRSTGCGSSSRGGPNCYNRWSYRSLPVPDGDGPHRIAVHRGCEPGDSFEINVTVECTGTRATAPPTAQPTAQPTPSTHVTCCVALRPDYTVQWCRSSCQNGPEGSLNDWNPACQRGDQDRIDEGQNQHVCDCSCGDAASPTAAPSTAGSVQAATGDLIGLIANLTELLSGLTSPNTAVQPEVVTEVLTLAADGVAGWLVEVAEASVTAGADGREDDRAVVEVPAEEREAFGQAQELTANLTLLAAAALSTNTVSQATSADGAVALTAAHAALDSDKLVYPFFAAGYTGAAACLQAPTTAAPTTAAPTTAAPSTTPFEVVSGGAYCEITASQICVTDGTGSHGNGEACTIQMLQPGFLTSTEFDTEGCCDRVTVGGTPYSGSTGPQNLSVSSGDTLSWRSDHSVANSGWTICFRPVSTLNPTPAPNPTAAAEVETSPCIGAMAAAGIGGDGDAPSDTNKMMLPAPRLIGATGATARVGFVEFASPLFVGLVGTKAIASNVLSATVAGVAHNTPFGGTARVEFNLTTDTGTEVNTGNPCMFWDERALDWSSVGCDHLGTVGGPARARPVVMCACNHLTSFAILTDANAASGAAGGLSEAEQHNLTWFVFVCVGISIVCLTVVIMVYASSADLRSETKIILMHLCASYDLALILFLVTATNDYEGMWYQ